MTPAWRSDRRGRRTGAHDTGAYVGMPRARKAVKAWQALFIMAPLAWLEATMASHRVEHTVAGAAPQSRRPAHSLAVLRTPFGVPGDHVAIA